VEEILELLRRHDELRVQGEIVPGVDRKLRKEVLLVNVDAGEPVGVTDGLDTAGPPDPTQITDGQWEGERDGVAGDEALGRGRLGPRIPGIHHRTQDRKGQHGHHDARDRKPGPERVPAEIADDETEIEDARHRDTVCPGTAGL